MKRFSFFTPRLLAADGLALDVSGLGDVHAKGHAIFQQDGKNKRVVIAADAGLEQVVLAFSDGMLACMGNTELKPVMFTEHDTTALFVRVIERNLILTITPGEVIVRRMHTSDNTTTLTILFSKRLPRNNPVAFDCYVKGPTIMMALGYQTGVVSIVALAMSTTTTTTSTGTLREVACLNDPTMQDRKLVDDEAIISLLFASPPPSLPRHIVRNDLPNEVFVVNRHSIKSWNFHSPTPIVLERNPTTTTTPSLLSTTTCCMVAPLQQQLAVAHSDRVALYSVDAPGSCYALSSVTPSMPQPPPPHPSQEVTHIGSINNQMIVITSARHVQIYDFTHKFISFSSSSLLQQHQQGTSYTGADVEFVTHVLIPNSHSTPTTTTAPSSSSPRDLLSSFSQVYIITNKNRIFILYEKSTPQKLHELMRRNLYSLASKLAIGQEPATVADIHKRHADHLYDKGAFQESVEIYALIADRIEPSYVIRKFFDTPRVAQLVYYLEALHFSSNNNNNAATRKRSSSPDLTVLLLNCYVRLPDAADKISALLRTSESLFDVDSALSVLKDTKYLPQAMQLAKDRSRHAWVVEALLAAQDHNKVITYITDVVTKPQQVVELLIQYGASLCRVLPQDTYELAIKAVTQDPTISPDALIDTFAEHPKQLVGLLEHCTSRPGIMSSPRIWNTLLELYLILPTLNHDLAINLLSDPKSNYDRAVCSTLCREVGFRRGLLVLYERNAEWDLLIREYAEQDANQEDRVISLAKTHCPRDVDVWMFLLGQFAQQNSPFLKAALRHVEQLDVLPPLMVLRLLSRVPHLPLSAVKPYLSSQIERAARQSAADEAEIVQLEEDTTRMQTELTQLRTKPIEFRATTCALTGAPLELPTVHFLSMNSYNMSSLQATSFKLEDPKCVVQHRDVLDIARGLAKNRGEIDEEFFGELDQAAPGEQSFGVVAAAFGKCLFEG